MLKAIDTYRIWNYKIEQIEPNKEQIKQKEQDRSIVLFNFQMAPAAISLANIIFMQWLQTSIKLIHLAHLWWGQLSAACLSTRYTVRTKHQFLQHCNMLGHKGQAYTTYPIWQQYVYTTSGKFN